MPYLCVLGLYNMNHSTLHGYLTVLIASTTSRIIVDAKQARFIRYVRVGRLFEHSLLARPYVAAYEYVAE